MNAWVIGGDRLGNMPEMLATYGIQVTRHITGRKPATARRQPKLPRNTQLLILLTDCLAHAVMWRFRDLAKAAGVPVVACKRSSVCLAQALHACLGLESAPYHLCPRHASGQDEARMQVKTIPINKR